MALLDVLDGSTTTHTDHPFLTSSGKLHFANSKGDRRKTSTVWDTESDTPSKSAGVHKVADFRYLESHHEISQGSSLNSAHTTRTSLSSSRTLNTDVLETRLRKKIETNLPLILKGLQLYDYNRDNKVVREDLRRVLEHYCFKLSDQQCDKLWKYYGLNNSGLINYKEFLRRLGVSVSEAVNPTPSNSSNVVAQIQNPDLIEAEFRKKMSLNYHKLKKVFLAFDKHMSGFIWIADLKKILASFILPMSDQMFVYLMERCGVRATGRVKWEIFLEYFQNPVTKGNGQTIPIRPNYRLHPMTEPPLQVDLETVWQQLDKRVHAHFNSLKEAFLQIDKNRDGRITRKEFRDLIETLVFRLDDKLFKALMMRIDPEINNSVDYHTFLRLFEEKETKEGHKWLRSVHRYNQTEKMPAVAWTTVEEILQEKIVYYWKDVSDWLKHYDTSCTGYLAKAVLKKVIDLQVLPLSDEHYESLVSRCSDVWQGQVNYMEFFQKLGVNLTADDLQGLSSQITDNSNMTEINRQCDQIQRLDQIAVNQLHQNSGLTGDEVFSLIKDKLPALRQVFKKFDKSKKKHISLKQFRTILDRDLGILIPDEQFSTLLSKLNIKENYLHLDDVISYLSTPLTTTVSREHRSNHKVNSIRGDESGTTAQEAVSKLKQKLRENFFNLQDVFQKFDDLRLGYIDRAGIRQMLDSCMIFLSVEEFDKLCLSLEIGPGCKVLYLDFLKRFEERDSTEGHAWLNSVHRFNSTNNAKTLNAQEAFDLLVQKLHAQWPSLSKAFRSMDKQGRGVITKQALQETLHQLAIPVKPADMKLLWTGLDTDRKNYLTHQDFLHNLAAQEFAPVDGGPSRQIQLNNYQCMKKHVQNQQRKQGQITQHQINLASMLPVSHIEQQLKDKIRDSYSDLYTAFCKFDTSKSGVLTAKDIQAVLQQEQILISDQQMHNLLDRLGLLKPGSYIRYSEFLQAFEEGRKSSYGQEQLNVNVLPFEPSSPEEQLRMKVVCNIADIYKTMEALDKEDRGQLPISDFRRVLDMFCSTLSDTQWKQLKTELTITSDHCVDYKAFLSPFFPVQFNDLSRHSLVTPECSLVHSTLPFIDDLFERVHQAVVAHYQSILRQFESMDSAKTGRVTSHELKQVLDKHTEELGEEQFERLLAICPVDEDQNINYQQFLMMFSEDAGRVSRASTQPPSRAAAPSRLSSSAFSRASSSRLGSRPFSRWSSRPSTSGSHSVRSRCSRRSTPMVNAESAEHQIKHLVLSHWHEMHKSCRDMDTEHTGTISCQQFKDLLARFNLQISPSDLNDLVTKYDIYENGRLCYTDFIRHFLTVVRSRQDSTVADKPGMNEHEDHTLSSQKETPHDWIRRTKDCVQQNWKEMRREFRAADPHLQARVPTEKFRQIIRKFNINMSESEFHLLQDKYDPLFDDLINYNDFIKDHLQS